MPNILVIQEESINQKLVLNLLSSNGYDVFAADEVSKGLEISQQHEIDLILLDLHLHEVITNGAQSLKSVAPIICMSSPFLTERIEKGKNINAIGHIRKPIKTFELITTITNATQNSLNNKIKTFHDKVLIVDDIDTNLLLLESLLLPQGYDFIKAKCGEDALQLASDHKPDLILLDIMMPGMDGFEVCAKLKENKATQHIPVIFVSALDSVNEKVKGFDIGGYDFITKPFYHNEVRARVSSALKLKRLQDKLTVQNTTLLKQNQELEASHQIILSLIEAVEAKCPHLNGHTARVASIAVEIAGYMGLTFDEISIVKQSAILHDVGKIGIPDELLNKKEPLNEAEYAEVKKHSAIGENILRPLKNFERVRQIVRHHHEKLDGSGYPDGIKGEEIDILTRIVSVADVYDSLSTDRPYRTRLSFPKVRDILFEEVDKGWWDENVVRALLDIIEQKS